MRNLKRALSLALAAAMLISMMVIGASAAEYGDEASVSQTEAVDVLTAIGVVGGDQNGNFNPKATLTRAEFCVMVANALTGGTFDPVLFDGTSTPFTDVKGHWGANYIAYCYAVGVIAGTSATTFSPDATLTAAQASAILLMALGYNQNNEFGANGQFELNVTKWADGCGLYDGLSMSASAGISRENTARLIFNALTNTTPVNYNTLSNAYYTVGTNVLDGIVLHDDDLNAAAWATTTEPYRSTLGFKNFSLTQNGGVTADKFGRPAVQWQYPVAGVRTPIGVYTNEAVLTYTKAVELGTIYQDLSLSAAKATNNVYFYNDGDCDQTTATTPATTNKVFAVDGTDLFTKGLTKGDKTKIGGNGVLTQVYSLSNGDVVITMVNTYIGEVVSITNATTTAGRKINIAGYTSAAGAFETDDFAREDVVLYTYSNQTNTVQSVALAEKVTGQLTAYTTDKSVVVGGVTYEYGAKIDTTANNSELKIDVDVYLDQYGYAMDIEGVKTSSDYAFLLKYSTSGGDYGLDNVARLLKADGTIVDVKVESFTNGDGYTFGTSGSDVGVVSYTVNSDDEYALTMVDQKATATGAMDVNQGASSVKLDGSTTVVANGKTAFLVVTGTAAKPVYTAYNGIANVPSIDWAGAGTAPVFAYATEKGVATYIYIDARNADTISSDATEVVYILGDSKVKKVTDADGDYYVYDAVIDGNITTIKVGATLAVSEGLTSGSTQVYKSVNYNDKGIMVSIGERGNAGVGTSKVTNGTVGLAGSWYSYTDDVTVFRIDDVKENISVSSIGSISTDSTDTVKFVLNATNKVVAIFVEDVLSGSNSVAANGHKVYVNGEEATLTSESATGATITSTVKAGDVITFAPATSNMATATAVVNGTTSNSYVVTGGTSVIYKVTVVAEDGTAAAPINFTITYTVTP